MDFNTIPPAISYLFNEMNFLQTNASISNSIGKLQFYTNGLYVSNGDHNQMQNGNGLNPGQFAEDMDGLGYILNQGAIIIPHPDGTNRFYLMHVDRRYTTAQLAGNSKFKYYTLIDMDLGGGLGEVVAKNQVVIDDTLGLGKLTAVRHANGRDWWMVVHEMVSKKYHRILITPDGVSSLGLASTPYTIQGEEGVGQSVFSPDGSIFARVNSVSFELGQFLEIYDFDRCTGYLAPKTKVHYDDDALSTGVAISPNSRFLYVSSFDHLYQYDLEAANIPASKKTIDYDGFVEESTGFSLQFNLAQLAPDGKIYINTVNGTSYLHVIHQPDLLYPDCMVEQHGITLPTYNAFSMPNFPNYRLGPLDGSPCDTLGLDNHPVAKFRYDQDTANYLRVRFTDLSYYEPTSWSWDFGDGTTSDFTSLVHEFPSDGTYEVCLTVSNQYDTSSFCRTLIIGTGISATSEAKPLDLISVFPNPASTATNFRLGGEYLPRAAMLTLYNATGQPVLGQRLTAGWSVVQLESLVPGMYFWEVRDEGRVLGTGKLVKVE